jgi:hypothetical protein
MQDRINIEYDCDCDHGMCQHALDQVQKAIQEAYDRGVRDGSVAAMGGLKEKLRLEFPKEFNEAQKVLAKRNNKKEAVN